ncbi:MAG: family 43 glycosylhydrolase [Oscillospiraceae bacterium]|nr:family 43 glycosylhydrolase [Oscillospiraceae bacterium]
MKLKRIICAASAAAMLISVMPTSISAAENDAGGFSPVISVTFDDGSAAYNLHDGAALTDGRDGKALSLNGNGQYADINGIAETLAKIDGDFTISVWTNPSSITTWSRIYDFGNGSSGKYMFLTPSNGSKPRFAVTDGTGEQTIDSDPQLTIGEWHNLVIKREGGVSTFYIDGYETGSSTALAYNFSDLGVMENYYLGKSQFAADPYYSGLIDDFLVYDSALSLDQIRTIAAEAYESKRNKELAEYNCYIVDTHFYMQGEELLSLDALPIPMLPSPGVIYISNKTYENGEASFFLANANRNDASKLAAYVAEYDDGGKLVKVVKVDLADNVETNSENIKIPFEAENEADEVKIFVWNDMKPVMDVTLPDLTVTSTVQNYTSHDGNVKTELYSVDKNGNEQLLAASDEVNIASTSSGELTITAPYRAIANASMQSSKLLVKAIVPNQNGENNTYDSAALYCGIQAPVAAPADSDNTTNGAHDPSIVKFPGDDTYYVYSSHHLIFTSEDLINWKKYDFTNINAKDITPKTYSFISKNYSNTTMNGTYWAPDVIYREGDDHPYWMYISVSCGLGGRNSAISLMKSDSPLFWADKNADIVDAGIVFATKETSSYKTNAIDANIYVDSNNGKEYFIWGSFWGGIQAAPLTEDGFVEGINYTSDATILSSCQNFGTSIFTQKDGVAGPEGAWMVEHGDYRYLFTSYGWLGSNYNTRLARAPLSTPFSTNMGTQLVDANNVVMGTQQSAGSITSAPTGYKVIGSYRLGDGSMNVVNDTHNYYVPYSSGDAITYYGPGHNSAINVGNNSFYVSHTRINHPEGAATLQIRKMLYTSDGWPVVSPVTYAGEVAQALPIEMLYGTYDLASVGRTKMIGSKVGETGNGLVDVNRNYDLPVLSSKVTLNADGSMTDAEGGALGTWTFDGDYTITLKFTVNGDESLDEFYKSGDTMTMYALYGYDKDISSPVIALTGVDQKHVTQFAKKALSNVFRTPAETVSEPDAIVIEKSTGGNPELGFDSDGNILYAGDPAATVIGDTVYLIAGHDTATDESYVMPEWVLYTSKNMTDWEYKGTVMKATDISWRSNDTSAWASQMCEYNGKYYLYYCTWDKTSSGKHSIGVAVADKPEGPYKDIGAPLVKGTFTEPETSGWNDIDPTVLIDTDENGVEHRYLAWGNGKYYICELNEDMISVKDIDGDGEIKMHLDVKERTIKSMNGGVFTEAPWLYKRDGKYYLFYAMNWREEMAYAMMDDPMGRYDYKQTLMPPTATSNTNHPSVIDFNGKTYFIYHNGSLPHGSGFRRSVCIQELEFDENGYVYPLTETSIGLTGKASTIITADGKYAAHSPFRNSLADAAYPISAQLTVADTQTDYSSAWEIMPGKADASNENYVSLQSVDKPGLYIASTGSGVTLTQDANGTDAEAQKMTFKTVKALNGSNGVSFVSVSDPDRYLTAVGSSLTLSYGADADAASFTIGEAGPEPKQAIKVADPEPEPEAEADIKQDFNVDAGTLISLTNDATPYTKLAGVTLYMGTRANDFQPGQNFAIQSDGVTGNALVMNAGKYNSASRGPRMQIYTPAIPNGYTVTASIMVKQGTASSVLRYNDSTSSDAGTQINGLTTEYQELKVTITNDNDTYTRTITLGGNEIAKDYVNVFPVLWGTTDNNSGQSIYFDDLSITTTDDSGNTPEPPVVTLPDPTSKFEFEGDLNDSISSTSGTLAAEKITSGAAAPASAEYDTGYTGKAVKFTGDGGYGVNLGNIITKSNYTVSFRMKANAITVHTAGIFIDSGDAETQRWISAPIGWKTDNTLMVWSNDGSWVDMESSFTAQTNTWYQITIAASGGTAKMYVDGNLIAEGRIANVITSDTTIYLGVNYWDTPFNGLIDDLYVYNGTTLSAAQAKMLYENTSK